MVRGIIEMIPIIGRIFICRRSPSTLRSESNDYYASYFLVKVFNPKKIEGTDAVFALYKSHPFLSVPEISQKEIVYCFKRGGVFTDASFIEETYHYKLHISCGTIERAYSHKISRTVDKETYNKWSNSNSNRTRPPGEFNGCGLGISGS